jgi:hypothetical protein
VEGSKYSLGCTNTSAFFFPNSEERCLNTELCKSEDKLEIKTHMNTFFL